MLIATLIFATVIAALNAVLFAGLQLRAKTSRLIEDATPLNRAAALIRRDFQGLVPPGDGMAGQLTSGTQPTGMEEYGGLEIYTSTGITDDQLYPHGDVQKVGYFLRPATNVMDTFGKDLVRLVTRNLLATVEEWPAEQRLLNGVDRLQFYFLSGTETGWREYWDSSTEETVLPKAIKMRLEFAVDPRDPDQRKLPFELVVPILSQKRTNATENAESTGETETPGGGGNNNTGGNNPPAGNNTSGGAAGGGAPGGAGGGGGGGGGGGQRGGAPR